MPGCDLSELPAGACGGHYNSALAHFVMPSEDVLANQPERNCDARMLKAWAGGQRVFATTAGCAVARYNFGKLSTIPARS